MTDAPFDELIHPVTRLSIVALLAPAEWVDFAFLRDELSLSDSALSKQLSALQDAGYVDGDHVVADRRRRVRLRLTAKGRKALQGHVAALEAIMSAGEQPSGS